jgi:hypothetical protein
MTDKTKSVAEFNPDKPADQMDSVPTGTKRHEPGPAEQARRKANNQRDGRVNLGVGKPSGVVTD